MLLAGLSMRYLQEARRQHLHRLQCPKGYHSLLGRTDYPHYLGRGTIHPDGESRLQEGPSYTDQNEGRGTVLGFSITDDRPLTECPEATVESDGSPEGTAAIQSYEYEVSYWKKYGVPHVASLDTMNRQRPQLSRNRSWHLSAVWAFYSI